MLFACLSIVADEQLFRLMANMVVSQETPILGTGEYNTAVGFRPLSNNTTGDNNSAIGNLALNSNSIGMLNSAFGAYSDVATGNLTNATAIGSRAQVAASNSMVLGSINGVNGATASTNVGIGTTSPQTRLDIMDENVVTNFGIDGNFGVAQCRLGLWYSMRSYDRSGSRTGIVHESTSGRDGSRTQ